MGGVPCLPLLVAPGLLRMGTCPWETVVAALEREDILSRDVC